MNDSKNPSPWQRFLRRDLSSEGQSSASVPNRRTEPRFERTRLAHITEKISIRLKKKKKTIQSEVLDLSLNGFCFRVKPALDFIRPGDKVELFFILGEREHELTVKITNKRGPYVGCRILQRSPSWEAEVADYLGPLEMGQRLYEIDPRLIQTQGQTATLHWFQSSPGCDLFYWSDPEDEIQKVQLVYAWHVVEWTPGQGFRTGEMTAQPFEKEDRSYPMSKVYDLQFPPDKKLVASARRLVLAARVPAAVRKIFS